MYSETTHYIQVDVTPQYIADQSRPQDDLFVWSYTITIRNTGTDTVQLLSRNWTIINARGEKNEITGAGVIGETPILTAGESFTYTSGVPLSTSSGMMFGSYTFTRIAAAREPLFAVTIPAFSLDIPNQTPIVN
jgi:ApaG protein